MADITKTTRNVTLESRFRDGDTRLLTVANPRTDITASEVKVFQAWVKENQPIIGDKGGAEFVGFNSPVKITEKSVTTLDLA